tara:strand:+ start:459 stop:752 length:294 start_codon:yes stop_codon:yes gene_type:complete
MNSKFASPFMAKSPLFDRMFLAGGKMTAQEKKTARLAGRAERVKGKAREKEAAGKDKAAKRKFDRAEKIYDKFEEVRGDIDITSEMNEHAKKVRARK